MVLRNLTGDSALTVAPMAPFDCNRHSILKSGIANLPRIINYSTGESKTPAACQNAYPELAETPFLWIFAAGNEGYKSSTQTRLICPQNSVPRTKKIIVGAIDSSGNAAAYSNPVKSYIDIYAPGNACPENVADCPGGEGTSFAAPKVSAIAAKIAKVYPQLSNDEIRVAILITANETTDLPALSHGVLDGDRAMKYASALSKTGNFEKAIDSVYSWREFYNWSTRYRSHKRAVLKDILAVGEKPRHL
jgi:subtilisin family serine protease